MFKKIIIYEKENGNVFLRFRSNIPETYGQNNTTSMGWKVIDVLYEYEGNFYKKESYDRIIRGKQLKPKKPKKLLNFVIKKLQTIADN